MDISKYLPINTKDKVDAIIDDLLKYKASISIENEILGQINKFKIQLYFKERFDSVKDILIREEVKSLPRIKRYKSREREYTPEYKLQKMISELPIAEISKLLDVSVGRIIKIIRQKNSNLPDLDRGSFLSPNTILSCIDFFLSAYNAKQRKEKMAKYEREKPSPRILEEKFKPSYGKEGNYGKLILYGPKT